MSDIELAGIRRLRLRSFVRGLDDLGKLVDSPVSPEVATRAVERLLRRGWVMLVLGVLLLAGGLTVLAARPTLPYWAFEGFAVLAALVGLLIPSGLVATVRWRRRLRSVRDHGWRPGHATLLGWAKSGAILDVDLAGEPGRLRTTCPVSRPLPPGLHSSDVQVGGAGEALVILFHRGPFLMAAKPHRAPLVVDGPSLDQGPVGDWVVSPEEANLAVRRRLRRVLVAVLATAAVAGAAGYAAIELSWQHIDLMTYGTETAGQVLDVRYDTGSISVTYSADGLERVGWVKLVEPRTASAFGFGDEVTVYYDPADPLRFDTPYGDDPDLTWFVLLVLGVFFVWVVVAVIGTICVLRWWRRLRSVRAHGWRPGRALVVQRGLGAVVADVRLADRTVRLCSTGAFAPWSRERKLTGGDVSLGGAGSTLVIMFRTGSGLLAVRP